MKIEYRLLEIIECNRLGDKKYYYQVQCQYSFLFDLIKFPWINFKYHYVNGCGQVESDFYGEYRKSSKKIYDYKKAEEILKCLKNKKSKKIFPAINQGDLVICCKYPKRDYAKFFKTWEEASAWEDENYYYVHRKTPLK